MEGETRSNHVVKLEAVPDVEPISIQRCCSSLVPDQTPSTDRICRYKECRRNHAASFGRYAIDGCREFICCNEDVFMCSACGCHRSFHRKDYPPPTPFLAPMPLASHNGLTGETSLFIEDRNNNDAWSETLCGTEVEENRETKRRAKRSRLTVEQKNKMMRFADKLGWRSQRENDAEIQHFCDEAGITKRVFLVWLNNNRRRRDPAP